jgi:hypothetical protein
VRLKYFKQLQRLSVRNADDDDDDDNNNNNNNIKKFHLLPTQCIYPFCVDLRTNSHFSLYSIN